MRWLALGFAVLLGATTAAADSPLAAEVHAWSTRYHENLPRIDQMRGLLADAIKADPSVDNLVALAMVCFIYGDIRAKTPEEKLEAYDQGREAARRAVEQDPRNVQAHFWYGTDTARWGQTKGVLRSLFLLPTVKREIETVLKLDPKFPPVYSLAGNVYLEVPRIAGGDLNKAEEMFRKGLELDPKFTSPRVGLARTLIKKGRLPEARQELEAVLNEKSPANLADWTMKDSKRARELLESIKGQS